MHVKTEPARRDCIPAASGTLGEVAGAVPQQDTYAGRLEAMGIAGCVGQGRGYRDGFEAGWNVAWLKAPKRAWHDWVAPGGGWLALVGWLWVRLPFVILTHKLLWLRHNA